MKSIFFSRWCLLAIGAVLLAGCTSTGDSSQPKKNRPQSGWINM